MQNLRAEDWQTLGSELVFQGWVKVARDRLRKPSGDEMDYTYILTRNAVAVLAFRSDGHVVLTRQYRHPVRRMVFDLPAGGIHEEETAEQAALRELTEETGFRANRIEWLGAFIPAPGLMSHSVSVFLADGLQGGKQNLDEHEIIEVVLMEW